MNKLLFIITMYILTTAAQANDAEQCIYGLYNQDTNELIIEGSKEYIEAIEHEFNNDDVTTTLEIERCL